jgi:hypothetical protein
MISPFSYSVNHNKFNKNKSRGVARRPGSHLRLGTAVKSSELVSWPKAVPMGCHERGGGVAVFFLNQFSMKY